jgi:hypothetical protein|tara:strand:+ start:6509 stop:7072 length:564 start_codon:yes stop_codon:yes gene_type:complete
MKTINIHGKQYVEVNERIKYFRENFKDWALVSDIIELSENRCVVKSEVKNPDGVVKATGIAYEILGSTNVNKTSFVENCETSANGRALGNLGIGIDTSIASADEVKMAIAQKETKPTKITNKQFEAMKSSIADGKQEVVKSRMKKYIFTKEQELEINNLLSGKTKITSVSEILEDLGDKMLEYNDLK